MTKNPLRLVTARFPRYEVLYGDPEHESLVGWLDTLECGHQAFPHNFGLAQPDFGAEGGRKRHRCVECGAKIAAQGVPKKPAQSVKREDIGPAAKGAAA